MKTIIAIGTAVLTVLAVGYRTFVKEVDSITPASSTITRSADGAAAHPSFLYGRVETDDGAVYEGPLRFGGDEEAFWGHYFNGAKNENPWAGQVPDEHLSETVPIEIFGIEMARRRREIDLERPFMARFGDIARLEADGRDLRVILKSGTVFHLDRFGADDFADGVRVWDDRRGIVDLDEWKIRSIEFLPAARANATPDRLYGTVHTAYGDFTGFLQWNREESVRSDRLDGKTAEGELSLRFENIRSIARRSRVSSVVTLLDGRQIILPDTPRGHRGIYVDDRRYGRVLVSWDAFEHVVFSPGGAGPAYYDFPPGRPLTGSVLTRSGRRLIGRLVYDLDESESTETLDAPSRGVDYTIPFEMIASIAPRLEFARVILRSGEELQLENRGDLGERNAGMLVFVEGRKRSEFVPWSEVEQVDFDGRRKP